MIWAKRLLLAVMVILVASPALAGIKQFTDEKGVVHIINNNKEKPRLQEQEPPNDQPEPNPRQAPPQEKDQLKPEKDQKQPKPSTRQTVKNGIIHLTNRPERTVERLAESPDGNSLPISQVSTAPAVSNNFAPEPALAGARVRTCKDRQGVIHIANAPARRSDQNIMVAGWSSQAAEKKAALNQESREPTISEERPAETGTPSTFLAGKTKAEDLGLRKVSFEAESQPPLPWGKLAGSGKAPRRSPQGAGVRRYRDGKGVIHIVGKGFSQGNSPVPAPFMAAAPTAWTSPPLLAKRRISRAGLGLRAGWPRWRQTYEPTVLVRKDKQGKILISNSLPVQNPKNRKDRLRLAKARLRPVLMEATQAFGLPISLIEAVIKVESNFRAQAVSPKGAMGLMQLMPGTAKFLGVDNAFCPRQNVLGGCRYLRLLLDFFGQSLPLALAAYNAGFKRVIQAGYQVPEIKETQAFVTQVLGNYRAKEKLRYGGPRLNL